MLASELYARQRPRQMLARPRQASPGEPSGERGLTSELTGEVWLKYASLPLSVRVISV